MTKGQLSIDIIMTYGVVILLVLSVLGGMLYFGVINIPPPEIKDDEIPDCDYVVYLDNIYKDASDCYEDIFYNRLQEIDKEGFVCFYNSYSDFMIRCYSKCVNDGCDIVMNSSGDI